MSAWYLFLFIPLSVIFLYAIGYWLLRRQYYRYYGIPTRYDGKEPFEEWAHKMEQARRLQAIEERTKEGKDDA